MVTPIFDPVSRQHLLMREHTSNEFKKISRLVLASDERRAMTHPGIVPLIDYSFAKFKSLCSTYYILRQYFEQPRYDLRQDIQRLKLKGE